MADNRIMSPEDFGLTADRDAAAAMQHCLHPLPRSIVRSHAYELLDGVWQFDLDLENRGLAEQWYLAHVLSRTAIWPGSIESQMAEGKQAQQQTPPWQDTVIAWYERDFSIPDQWCTAPECSIQVTFMRAATKPECG